MGTLLWLSLLLLFLLLLKIQIEVKVIIKDGKNFSFAVLRFMGLFRLRLNLSIGKNKRGDISLTLRKSDSDLDQKTSLEEAWEMLRRLVPLVGKYKEPLRFLKSKIQFHNFSLLTKIGTGDAAVTSLTIGVFYAFFSLVKRILDQNYHLQNSKLVVLPYFQGLLFDLDLDCIINFRFGHIIITGLKMLLKNGEAV